ncbi:MAG: hypothetical protein IJ481_01610 [Alphaproteobacteria bacterium]|nr:hypothetical protein [Alphaproteobacteria bacterium]
MNNNISVLKIQTNGKDVLVANDAKQEISPTEDLCIHRTLDYSPIFYNTRQKLKTVISTCSIPNIDLLKINEVYSIFSVAYLLCKNNQDNVYDCIRDSIVNLEDGFAFRPRLDMILTNFVCKAESEGKQFWKFEFVET